jgi:hypothetical protein
VTPPQCSQGEPGTMLYDDCYDRDCPLHGPLPDNEAIEIGTNMWVTRGLLRTYRKFRLWMQEQESP